MNEWLLDKLVCPQDGQKLLFDDERLTCCGGHRYPVINGIPMMLFDDGNPTHDYARQTLEQAARIGEGQSITSVTRNNQSITDDVDGFVQGELPYTNGNLYFSVQNKLTRYPLPHLRLPNANGERLLDVGCNWGRWTIAAANKGYRPVGVDPSLDAVLAAQRISRQLNIEAEFVVGDARHLPFADCSFDVVFSYSVLQHFSKENARTALKEMYRTLGAGGKALVQMPNKFGIRSFQQRWRRGFTEGKGFEVRYWAPSELLDTFENLFGRTKLTVDCYFGLGIQASDADLLPARFRLVVYSSELLRKISKRFKPLVKVADSVYLESYKSN